MDLFSTPAGKVAAVVPLLQVVHLDRPFDYEIPAEFLGTVQVGTQVIVPFNGRRVSAIVVALRSASKYSLKKIVRVPTSEVLAPKETLEFSAALAAHYATTQASVLRRAVLPRHKKAETELNQQGRPHHHYEPQSAYLWKQYEGGIEMIARLRTSPGSFQAYSWMAAPSQEDGHPYRALAQAALATAAVGSTAILVFPSNTHVQRMGAALSTIAPENSWVEISSNTTPATAYKAFLGALRGWKRIIIGTRRAAYMPAPKIGLCAWWDDTDPAHSELRAPYAHVREILRIRAEKTGAVLLSAGYSRSIAGQYAVENDVMATIASPQQRVHPQIFSLKPSADPSWSSMLPSKAIQLLRTGLETGPVLVQVPRWGFIPAAVCASCLGRARCHRCSGPLGIPAPRALPQCRWCLQQQAFLCQECGHQHLYGVGSGLSKHVAELGRTFAHTRVIESYRGHEKTAVSQKKAIVVSTPGYEPQAVGGYSAILLTDCMNLLMRPGLAAHERALSIWMQAAGMLRPGAEFGLTGVPVPAPPVVNALQMWKPAYWAAAELAERKILGLPPSQILTVLQGSNKDLKELFSAAKIAEIAEYLGPFSLPETGGLANRVLAGTAPGRQRKPADDCSTADSKIPSHPWRAMLRCTPDNLPQLAKALNEELRSRSLKKLGVVKVRIDAADDLIAL